MYWVSAILNWVFLKFVLGNTYLHLYFLYKTNYMYLHWVFTISFASLLPLV